MLKNGDKWGVTTMFHSALIDLSLLRHEISLLATKVRYAEQYGR